MKRKKGKNLPTENTEKQKTTEERTSKSLDLEHKDANLAMPYYYRQKKCGLLSSLHQMNRKKGHNLPTENTEEQRTTKERKSKNSYLDLKQKDSNAMPYYYR